MSDTYQEINTHLEPLWTVEQTAKYFGLNVQTVYRWIYKGKISSSKIGKSVRIPRSEVERLAQESQIKLQP